MKKTGRTSINYRLRMCLCAFVTVFLLGGCRLQELELESEDTRPLIDSWLAYKAQMEDTTPFAEQQAEDAAGTEEEIPDGGEGDDSGQEAASDEDPSESEAEETEPSKDDGPDPGSDAEEDQHGFYYAYLSDSVKVVYDEVLSALVNRRERKLSTLSDSQADLAFQSVLHDHPEIFYVSGYHLTQRTMDGQVIEVLLTGQYEYTQEETESRQKQIDAYVAEFEKGVPDTGDEYEKVKYVYDYLITRTSYNLDAPDNQNICSVFIGGQSVCQGYAEAAQYLLEHLGIETSIVTGTVNGGGRHAWNIVNVNGAYYYMDVTWGDVDYRAADHEEEDGKLVPVNYDYFLVTTDQLEKSHVIDSLITMPACVSMQDNYYVRENLYFEEFDLQKTGQAFARAYETGQQSVTLKCAGEAVYLEMEEYLVDENHVFEYIRARDSISYSVDTNMYTLCFWL